MSFCAISGPDLSARQLGHVERSSLTGVVVGSSLTTSKSVGGIRVLGRERGKREKREETK